MQDNSTDEPSSEGGGQFYEVLDLKLAHKPQMLLAYAMNGQPLPIKHGAPLRLRAETQVGFKMAKWINQINGHGVCCNLFMDYETIGEHQWAETGIFDFMAHLPGEILKNPENRFMTPSQMIET